MRRFSISGLIPVPYRKIFLVSLVLAFYQLNSPAKILAQDATEAGTQVYSLGIAENIEVAGDNLLPGQIVTFKDKGYSLSNIPYDPYTYGVIATNPAMEFVFVGIEKKTVPVIGRGSTPVLVSGINGPISIGDRITTSETPGIGMVANKSGLSIGTAEEAFEPSNPSDTGTIIVNLDIKFTLTQNTVDSQKIQSKLMDVVNLSSIAALEDPKEVLKYVLSAFIIVGSVAFSFLIFGRSAQNSILALGRNPLASRAISLGMILNIGMSLFIIISGVVTAWFVIRL